jgi:peptide-methionine (S)-S-oxide reductase
MFHKPFKTKLPSPDEALPGRQTSLDVPSTHHVTNGPLAPADAHLRQAMFGMGCFWGAERMFWETPGVISTNVGYAGGFTPNPTYEEVCTGGTGHVEVVRVFYDPARVSYDDLLRVFWEGHDPTQGMRQHGDIGTQYRSAVYYFDDEQRQAAEASRDAFQERLRAAGYGDITTEIAAAPEFYFAEAYHQQYLAKNPHGYCGHGGTGVACPIGLATR